MKKLLLLVVAFFLCLSLASCGLTLASKYKRAVKDLEAMPASYYWQQDDANNKNVKAKELYDKFLSFNGYKESAAYLSRFVIVPDALFRITTSRTDAFGQTSEYTCTYAHLYSSYGERVDSCPLFELLGVDWGSSESPLGFLSYEYEYEKEGVVKSIVFRIKLNGGTEILCKTTLERDNQGNIVSATTMSADGETRTSTYVYNEKNLLTSAAVYGFDVDGSSTDIFRDNFRTYHYVYDESGRLIEDGDTRYEYDENGRLIEAGDTRYEYDEQGFLIKETGSYESREYTYDKNGKISTVKVTTDDGKSYAQIYHYETLYLYFPEK